MPLDTTQGTILTHGTIAGYAVTTSRRSAVPTDALGNSTVLTVALKKAGTTYEALVTSDDGNGANIALAAGRAIVNAFASIGAQVTLGTAGQPPVASGKGGAGVDFPFSRAVDLTPGTPLPPSAGVTVFGPGTVTLTLSGGGTAQVTDITGGGLSGGGTLYRAYSAVDAIVPSGTKVQMMY